MARVWQVLARLLGGLGGLPAGARAQRSEALVAGARKYLEDNFVAYMQKVVAAHRTQVGWGGAGRVVSTRAGRLGRLAGRGLQARAPAARTTGAPHAV